MIVFPVNVNITEMYIKRHTFMHGGKGTCCTPEKRVTP